MARALSSLVTPTRLAVLFLAVVMAFGLAVISTPLLDAHAQDCGGGVGGNPPVYNNPYTPGTSEWSSYVSSYMYDLVVYNYYQQNTVSGGGEGGGGCGSGGGSADNPAVIILATPDHITQGENSILTWYSYNATSCTITQGIGPVTPNTSGSRTVSPSANTTYTINCSNANTGGSATASTVVTVTAAPAPTVSLTATPSTIASGSPSTLSWTSTNSNLCSIAPTVGTVPPNVPGSQAVSPTTNTTYAITCTGANGQQVTAYALVTVTGPLTGSCSASPTTITTGQSSTWTASASGGTGSYTYSWSGTDSLSGTASSVAKSYSTTGAKTGTVTITSGSQSNAFSCSNSVTVNPAGSPSLSCIVNPTTLPSTGGTVTYTASPAGLVPYSWNDAMGGSYATSASVSRVIPGSAGTYAMTVSKSGYNSGPCANVTVGASSCGTAIVSITASPKRVRSGQTSTISWTASGVDSSCTISGPGVSQTVSGASCVIPNSSAMPTITAQSVYTISCDGAERTAQAVVNLIPKFIEF